MSNGHVEPNSSTLLELTISISRTTYTSNEPVEVVGTFKNAGTSPVTLPAVLDLVTLRWFIGTSEDQADPIRSPYMINQTSLAGKLVALAPNETWTFRRTLGTSVLPLPKKPGSYVLFAMFENQLGKVDATPVWVGNIRSNVLILQLNSESSENS